MNKYIIGAYFIRYCHYLLIACNTVSIVFLVAYVPWYVFMPVGTILMSPIVGEERCILNLLENSFRIKGGLPPLTFKGLSRF